MRRLTTYRRGIRAYARTVGDGGGDGDGDGARIARGRARTHMARSGGMGGYATWGATSSV